MENTERKQVFEFLRKTEIHKRTGETLAFINYTFFNSFIGTASSYFNRLKDEPLESYLKDHYIVIPIDRLLEFYEIDEEFLDISND